MAKLPSKKLYQFILLTSFYKTLGPNFLNGIHLVSFFIKTLSCSAEKSLPHTINVVD